MLIIILLLFHCTKSSSSHLYIKKIHSHIKVSSAESHLRSLHHEKPHIRNHSHFHHHTKKCKETEFQCVSDGACIQGYKRCNDHPFDCSDNSDEFDCPGNAYVYPDHGNVSHCSYTYNFTIHIYVLLEVFHLLLLANVER